MRPKTLMKTGLAVTATAVTGSVTGRPDPTWYRRLRKPSWNPPSQAFGPVWTLLYGMIAYGSARALEAASPARRRALARTLGVNLALNAAWPPLFWRLRSPRAALAELVALNLSNAALVRQAWRADRAAGLILAPYAVWTGFATALNGAIVRRNRTARSTPARLLTAGRLRAGSRR